MSRSTAPVVAPVVASFVVLVVLLVIAAPLQVVGAGHQHERYSDSAT
ncbi:hypothetical protein [Cupriavidus pauculus]|nr:hypothetical protein [Cupriavidus pauculus]